MTITQVPPEDQPTLWNCKPDANGHAFAASYNEVEAGAGCPVCEVERLTKCISQAVIAVEDWENPRRYELVMDILERGLLPPESE